MVIVIDAPHFYVAVVTRRAVVVRAAPILRYMLDWPRQRVKTLLQAETMGLYTRTYHGIKLPKKRQIF